MGFNVANISLAEIGEVYTWRSTALLGIPGSRLLATERATNLQSGSPPIIGQQRRIGNRIDQWKLVAIAGLGQS
jgi:hypothetical protein